jgi:hypothetical protein
MELQIRKGRHPITGAATWSLWRTADGKLEAHGFDAPDEARAWAGQFGHAVLPFLGHTA